MDLIIAIFMYLGLMSPGQVPTATDIQNNQLTIEHTKSDPQFQQYYESAASPGVGSMDVEEW